MCHPPNAKTPAIMASAKGVSPVAPGAGATVEPGEGAATDRPATTSTTIASTLMIVSDVYDHQTRLRSFEMIAEAGSSLGLSAEASRDSRDSHE